MKIHIDNQIFRLQRYGGISRYFVRLVEEFDQLGHEPRILGSFHSNAYLRDLDSRLGSGRYFKKYPKRTIRLFRETGKILDQIQHFSKGADIIHESYFSDQPVLRGKQARVITEYDCMHEIFPYLFPVYQLKTAEKKRAFDRADLILAISHQTKSDIIEYFDIPEEKIVVTHLAADPKLPDHELISPKTTERPYFLYVGIRLPHKNFHSLLLSFAKSKYLMDHFDLVVFSPYPFLAEELALMEDLGYNPDQVRWESGDDRELFGYYQQAFAFVYPSLYEGFGIPPLEAMRYGCPVICSNSSSLPEVVGDAALTFDPMELEDMKSQMELVARKESLRNDLIAKGYLRVEEFSWRKTAEETLAHYNKIL